MALKSLQDLLVDEIKDIYYAEKKLTKALPKMAKKASSEELKTALMDHLEETENQITRLEKVFDQLGIAAKGKKCHAMDGLVEEGNELIEEKPPAEVLDAGLIVAAQKVEHYEMAAYGSIKTHATLLGLDKIAKLMDETLQEEGNADKKLTAIAESLNIEAV